MEYNNYFPAQPGIPPAGPPVMNNMQHGGSSAPMMQGPPPQHPHAPRQNVTPGPMIHHQPMQPQQQPPPNHHMSSPQLNQNSSPSLMPMGANQPPQPPSAPPPQVGTPHTPHSFMSPSPMMNHHPAYHQGVSPNQGPPPPPHGQPRYNHGPPPPPMHVGPPPPQHHVPMPSIPMHAHGPPPPNYGHGPGPAQYPPIERSSPFYQSIPQTEFRIIELNKRLQNRPKPTGPPSPLPIGSSIEESIWWDRFASDFFDDDATLTIRISPDDRPVEYTIGRPLIPRFFKSYFDGDVIDYSIKLRNSREIAHPHVITLECDQTDITTKNLFRHSAANMCVVVHSGGHLILDFVSSYDNLLIKSWRFYTHRCQEYIDRSLTSHNVANAHLVEPITKHGLTSTTISYLKMCRIMEPMQDLMIRHRQTKMDPRSCLKYLLNDKYKFKVTEEVKPPPPKRRKRKTPAATGATTNKRGKANANNMMNNNLNNNNINPNNMGFANNIGNNISLMSPANHMGGPPDLSLASQDVMVVGEPSMLGSDFNDENERRITRLENNQFETTLNTNNGICSNEIEDFGPENNTDLTVNPNQDQMINNNNSMLQNPQPILDHTEPEHNHQTQPGNNSNQTNTNNGDSMLTNNGTMDSIIDNGNSNNNLNNQNPSNSNSMLMNNMNNNNLNSMVENEDGTNSTPTTSKTTTTTSCSTAAATTTSSSMSTSLIMDGVSSNNNNPNMMNNNPSSIPPNTTISTITTTTTATTTTGAGDNPNLPTPQTAEIAN